MKMTFPVSAAVVAGAILMLVSCSGNKARLSGNLIGAQNQKITLEMVSSAGLSSADTITTDAKGNFRFTVKLPSEQATLYNLKINNQYIPLFISPGEKITVNTMYDSPKNYSVEGSPESVLLKEMSDIMRNGTRRLDSLAGAQALLDDNKQEQERNTREYIREYQNIKREQIKFIIQNKGNLAAVYALNQRLPNDEYLFSGENDIIYYRTVAEEVSKSYPGSPYVASLNSDITRYDNELEIANRLQQALDSETINFPEIEMPDIYGNMQKLSDRTGKVIIVDFWSLKFEQAAVINAEYRELYNEFKDRGLDIYQVSVDTSRPEWVNAVQSQRIPWTTLFDTKGSGSAAARSYNMSAVPANVLISAGGDIVSVNVYGEDLRKAVEREMKK